MNRTRILVGLLIASWTLNVALGVAFFLKTRMPTGGYFVEGSVPSGEFRQHRGEGMMAMRGQGKEIRDELLPLKQEQQQLMMRLAEIFASDELDSVQIHNVRDSIANVNRKIQESQIRFMMDNHGHIPPHARRELFPRMMRKMGDFRGGGPGPGHRPGRGGDRKMKRHDDRP